MSNQLKLFLYIVFVVAIFLFVQTKFQIFDVKIGNGLPETENTSDNGDTEKLASNYVEIISGADKSVKVDIELADTAEERSLGLSYRKYLGDYDGMLFVFEQDSNLPFWMKGMQIPLDMIFFDSKGFIVDMKENLAPCTNTYCPSIYSETSYRYVLEVNSGFIEKNEVSKVGSLVMHIESLN